MQSSFSTIRGICINEIDPGYMATDMNTKIIENKERNVQISARIPMGRWGKSDDIKGAAIFLGSSASDYISGAMLPVDGGCLIK